MTVQPPTEVPHATPVTADLSVRVEADLETALAAVEEIAAIWGGSWVRSGNGGRLELPVVAGLRRGVVAGELRAERDGRGQRLRFEPEAERYALQGRELVVLLLGAAGGLFLVAVPFVPALFDLIPMAGLLMLLAWFLVVSRMRHRNARDFLGEVAQEALDAGADTR